MPIFEYACRGCGHEFEAIVQRSTEPVCPSCRGKELVKQLSVFAVGGGEPASLAPATACGSCGDPRGPGACARNDN